ncbi:MAG TPA: cellulase family glycosylhydrolase [Pirellulales bacterium]|nr:cellulase family glycosylhydrolase [Pirellulales bacterium]
MSLGAAPSDEPAATIAGKRSLLVDTRRQGFEWCEFFRTDPEKVPLTPGATYTVRFKYRILDLGADDCYLYALVRSRSGGQKSVKGWTPIHAAQGAEGEKSFEVAIDEKTDYEVLIGFHNQGRLAIDEITIAKQRPAHIEPPAGARYDPQQIGFNTQATVWSPQSQVDRLYDKVRETGCGWVRATLFWDVLEPIQGQIDWSSGDRLFEAIRTRGLKYCCVIRSAPKWANGGHDCPLHNFASTDADAFESFCYQVARRYLNRGVTIAFEIGNEQNMQFFNMPKVDPAGYTRCQLIPASKGIRRAAREFDVAAPTILVGGFSPVEPKYIPHSMTPLDFMQAVYEHGGKGSFDTIAYHPYTYVAPPRPEHWTYQELRRVVELMESHGDRGKKVWATEVGYASGTGTGQVSEEQAARFTAETFDQWFALPYAGPLLWYELVDGRSYVSTDREQTFGLLHSGDWSEKPGYRFFLSKLRK